MDASRKYQPQHSPHIFLLKNSGDGKDGGERCQIPRVQILIHDVERSSRHRNR